MLIETIMKWISFLLVLSCIILIVEMVMPLYKKIEYIAVVRSSTLLAESKSGVNADIIDFTILELEEKGFTDVVVSGTTNIKAGEKGNISVECKYSHKKLIDLFTKENIVYIYSKNLIYISRYITN